MKNSFDDLIDVSVKAFKDGVLGKVNMNDLGVRELRYKLKDEDSDHIVFEQNDDYTNGVEFINSLYTEEFVIESVKDLQKTNDTSVIKTRFGDTISGSWSELRWARHNKIEENDAGGWKVDRDSAVELLTYIFKGATVTQKR